MCPEKTLIPKDICTPIAALLQLPRRRNNLNVPEWTKKMWCTSQNTVECYSAIKRINNAIHSNMVIWSEEVRQHLSHHITNMWNLKYDRNELIYEAETISQIHKANLW